MTNRNANLLEVVPVNNSFAPLLPLLYSVHHCHTNPATPNFLPTLAIIHKPCHWKDFRESNMLLWECKQRYGVCTHSDTIKINIQCLMQAQKERETHERVSCTTPFIYEHLWQPPWPHLQTSLTKLSNISHTSYQDLAPLRVYVLDEGLYLALVSIPLGLLPWSGSVSPNAPTISPLAVKRKMINSLVSTGPLILN